jgi:hypothetical protein
LEDIEMTYKILYAESTEGLEQQVNDHVKKGWRPQGGPFVMVAIFYQAVVKTE